MKTGYIVKNKVSNLFLLVNAKNNKYSIYRYSSTLDINHATIFKTYEDSEKEISSLNDYWQQHCVILHTDALILD